MRPAVVAALAVAALLPGAPASADSTGLGCGYAIREDPRRNVTTWYAEVDGGPLVLDEATFGSTGPATLTCTLQLAGDTMHGAPDLAVVTSHPTSRVVVVPPTLVEVPARDPNLCTRVDVAGGGTFHLHVPFDAAEPTYWTTDPAARCAVPTVTDPAEPEHEEPLRPYACPVLTGGLAAAEPGWGAAWSCP